MGGRMRRSSVTGNCAEGQQPAGLPQRDALPPREPPASWSGATAHRLPAGILPRLTPAAPARPPHPAPFSGQRNRVSITGARGRHPQQTGKERST